MSIKDNITSIHKTKSRNNLAKLLAKCIATNSEGSIDYYRTAENLIKENVSIREEKEDKNE